MMDDYRDFLASKRCYAEPSGFSPHLPLLPDLKDFQASAVSYMLRTGKGALFEECGLGKTIQELEWDYHVATQTGGLVLHLCPLAVAEQTLREAERFRIFSRDDRPQLPIGIFENHDAVPYLNGVVVTNYEKLKNFDTKRFKGVTLDESSILKSYQGKTKQELCRKFSATPFRLAATATPAPNDLMELGNHAEFLGVMPSSEMLARWFINDTSRVGKYRLKGFAEADYWEWVASWAVCLATPADLGFDDSGYVLPGMELYEHEVEVVDDEVPAGQLFANESVNATSIHKEKRKSVEARAAVVAELVNRGEPGEPWIVWCDTDYEADVLLKVIPEAVEVRGSHADLRKRKTIDKFSTGEARVIITKPEICGFGLNWQHCCHVAFVGLSYSFERFYQAIRRTLRFGQLRTVVVHVVNSPVESVVWRVVKRKELDHRNLQSQMATAMKAAQMENVRGIKKLVEYHAGKTMELPDWLVTKMGV